MDLRISVVSYATGTTKVWTVFALLETRSMCVMRWCNVHLVNYDMLLTSRGCVTDGGSESNPQEAQTCSITFKTTSKQNTLLMAVNCSLVLPPTILTFGSAISTWLYTIVSLSAVEARVHKSGHRVLRSKLFVLEATPLGAQTSTTGQSIHFPWLYHPAVKLEL